MRHRRRSTIAAIACATALLAGACTDGSDRADAPDDLGSARVGAPAEPDGAPTPKGRWVGRGLTPFDSCAALGDWLAEEGADRISAYGIDGPWLGPVDDVATMSFEEAADGAAGAPTARDEGGAITPTTGVPGEDYSATNVQESGIDEPDMVKTDGELLVAAVDGTLRIVDVRTSEPSLLASLVLDGGWGHELLLAGDRAFVLSLGEGELPGRAVEGAAEASSFMPYGETTVIQEIDLTTLTAPEVVATQVIEGRYLSARVVDGVARVVVTTPPTSLDLVTPTGPGAEDAAVETNRRILDDLDGEAWLPRITSVDGQQRAETEPLVDCADVGHPDEFSGFGTLSVVSIELDEPLDTSDAVSVLANGDTVYASAENLYVATTAWTGDEDPSTETTVHRFSIAEAGPVTYAGSGTVPGHLLNQFAMSEHEGVLRVATTEGSPWGGGDTSESLVTTLALDGQELTRLGEVGDMGHGEEIYAVRFLGDQAYVVTFRQTDPLYVVDLADPSDPRVTGELKIPGYSAYLHPLGDGRLLGVGQDGTDDGRLTGAAVSLFDVSDPTDPVRLDQLTFGNGSTPVEWDHRAFLWWDPEALAVVPMQTWDEGNQLHGAVGIDVSGSALIERGRMTPPAAATDCGDPLPVDTLDEAVGAPLPLVPCSFPDQQVQRAVVVGEHVLTVGSSGLGSHALDDLTAEGWLPWSA